MIRKLINKFWAITDLDPIKDWHTNNVLKGIEREGIVVVPDLPVTQLGDKVVSIWKTNSLRARLIFLFTGKVNFQILAPTHAPINISVGEYEKPSKGEENGED